MSSLVASGSSGASTASSCLKGGTNGLPATQGREANEELLALDLAALALASGSNAPPMEHILLPDSAQIVPVRLRPEVKATGSSERKTLAETS